ncbi:MAG: hypothetical protein KQH63_17055 [Desulfobulbaceae bacterium]|nr:hypothetical protein [Desulfobulbaceae bacterium]
MKTFRLLLTGSTAAFIALSGPISASHAGSMTPPAENMQLSADEGSHATPMLLALNDLGDLEITMELMDESSADADAIVNKIQLPVQLQKRKMVNEQKRQREKINSSDDILDKGYQIREQIKEHRSDSVNNINEQTQEIREQNNSIEEVREQAKEQQSEVIEDFRDEAKGQQSEVVEDIRDEARKQQSEVINNMDTRGEHNNTVNETRENTQRKRKD